MDIKIIHLEETDSTNRYLADYHGEEGSTMTVVWADYQTAGRGQGSNTWESQRGMNLTFSLKTYPTALDARRQFILSEATAIAICDALPLGLSIKWPNDIYWHDSKLSGTLSQCTLHQGRVAQCIVGIGINANQTLFTSGAPNPVSLRQITGNDVDRESLLTTIVERIAHYMEMVDLGDYSQIDNLYLRHLYRKTGMHLYEDANGRFEAETAGITPNGHLLLRRRDATIGEYAFKEVAFII